MSTTVAMISIVDTAADIAVVEVQTQWVLSVTGAMSGTDIVTAITEQLGSDAWQLTSAGADGAPGASAYEIAVDGGYVGTEAEWLASLARANVIPVVDTLPTSDLTDGLTVIVRAVTNP